MSRKKLNPLVNAIPAHQVEREQHEDVSPVRAYVYARSAVGGPEALARQVEACVEWAQGRGIEPVIVISDRCSGGVPFEEREGGRLLFLDLKKGDQLIVYSRDRLCRDMAEVSRIISKLSQRGVKLTVIDEAKRRQ